LSYSVQLQCCVSHISRNIWSWCLYRHYIKLCEHMASWVQFFSLSNIAEFTWFAPLKYHAWLFTVHTCRSAAYSSDCIKGAARHHSIVFGDLENSATCQHLPQSIWKVWRSKRVLMSNRSLSDCPCRAGECAATDWRWGHW